MRTLAEATKFRDGEDLKPKLKVYWELLKDLKPEVATRSMLELAKTSVWFPSVAEIREKSIEVGNDLFREKQERDWSIACARDEAIRLERLNQPGAARKVIESTVEQRRKEFQKALAEAGLLQGRNKDGSEINPKAR